MNAMAHILVYLLEASVAAVVFYLTIKMLMSNETCHGYIRVLWLGAIVLSVAMPFLRIPLPASVQFKVDKMHENILGGITAGEMEFTVAQPVAGGPDWRDILGYVYLAGAVAVALIYALSFIRMHRKMMRCPVSHEYDALVSQCAEAAGYRRPVRLRIGEGGPCSWMGNIVVGRKDIAVNGKEILLHEMGHIRGGRSWDVLLCSLFTCLLWFNPVSWLIQFSLRQVHEFCADSTVLRSGADVREYQKLLIRKTAGPAFCTVVSSFNHSNLKNRIVMMSKKQTGKGAYVKSLVMLPAFACLALMFSAGHPAGAVERLSSGSSAAVLVVAGPDAYDFDAVDVKPSFGDGSLYAFSNWLNANIVYPEAAIKSELQGRVTVSSCPD